jgi:hypothetical protein
MVWRNFTITMTQNSKTGSTVMTTLDPLHRTLIVIISNKSSLMETRK